MGSTASVKVNGVEFIIFADGSVEIKDGVKMPYSSFLVLSISNTANMDKSVFIVDIVHKNMNLPIGRLIFEMDNIYSNTLFMSLLSVVDEFKEFLENIMIDLDSAIPEDSYFYIDKITISPRRQHEILTKLKDIANIHLQIVDKLIVSAL